MIIKIMQHDKNINSLQVDKMLQEARSRKPVMELEEIESLLRNNNRQKPVAGYWKNISILLSTLIFGAGISVYILNDKNENATTKTTSPKIEKVENGNQSGVENNNFSTQQNTYAENGKNALVLKKESNKNNIAGSNAENQPLKIENSETANQNTWNTDSKKETGLPGFIPKEEQETRFTLKGWALGSKDLSQFNYGLDEEVVYTGGASAYISAKKENFNSAWLTQEMSAAPYAGKRLKMTAMVRSQNLGKKAWAGIFMNIKGNLFKIAGYDNMYEKNITGEKGWVKCELVMDVPESSKTITFGLFKVYGGDAWIDDVQFEVVNTEVPLRFKTTTEANDTNLVQPDISNYLLELIVEKPSNLDFEQLITSDLPKDWHIGEEKQHFQAKTDKKQTHSGNASVFLESNGYIAKDWNTLMQYCSAGEYLGKRIKLTAWVRTDNLKEHAQFVLRADGFYAEKNPANIKEFTFTGNNKWRRIELVLDVPQEATHITYGMLLTGKGKVWMDDISIEVLQTENININKKGAKLPVNLDFEE